MPKNQSLYDILGVHANISQEGIKKAYQNLLRTEHPDKGGDEERYEQIRKAYSVLSDPEQRKDYDRFGEEGLKEPTEEDRFANSFGTLKAKERKEESTMSTFTQALQTMDVNTIIKKEQDSSVGFEAWMRNRGERQIQMVTADTLADKYGIETAGYDPIPIMPLKVHVVRYQTHGDPEQVLYKKLEPLPAELHWKEVLVRMLIVPINPADFFSIEGIRDQTNQQPPYIAGSEGVGEVLKVGPGVENLHPHDWVVPNKVGLGTWRTIGVFREKDLWRIPADSISQEGAALLRPMCAAYRLLEDFASLKPGDCIIQNGANGAVGQAVIQICKVLRIQTINIVRERENWEQIAKYLKEIGATVVIKPTDSISKAIADNSLGQPRLGLDCVGGQVAVTMANVLRPSSTLVVYGGTSRKHIPITAPMLIFNDLSFKGFRLQKWIEDNPDAVRPMIDTISRLVKAGKCKIATKLFELGSDFETALVTALQEKRNAKVLLLVKDDLGEAVE